jgi:hypothetical protein
VATVRIRTFALSIALLAVTLAVAACDGDGDDPAPTKTPAPQATAVPPPDRPNSIRDYARIAAQYLTADSAASSGGNCLAALYTAWEMPYFSGDRSCRNGNADEDADDELVAVLAQTQGDGVGALYYATVAIFDRDADQFSVAYEALLVAVSEPDINHLGNRIIALGDLNGDGAGDLAYDDRNCGAHTCSAAIHIVSGTASGYVALTPEVGIGMPTADVRFEDLDGDGAKELILHGGEIRSAGAGPQRLRTETYAWDGEIYALRDTQLADPVYLYHAVIDGDRYFEEQSYDLAVAVYLAAAGNASLQTWKEAAMFPGGENERAELQAYALYRAGLTTLASGGSAETADAFFARAIAHTGTLHQQLAGVFRAAYAAKGELSVGCAAVRDALSANIDEYETFWDYGYANPEFDPGGVCPY